MEGPFPERIFIMGWNRMKIGRAAGRMGVLLFWLMVWQLLAMLVHQDLLVATPIAVGKRLLSDAGEADFWRTAVTSLLRILAGFLTGLVTGGLLAVLCMRSRAAESLLCPFVNFIKSVPVACFTVVLLIWWGVGFLSVAVSLLMVFPASFFSTLEGMRALDPGAREMARVFRLTLMTRVFYLYRPALKPFFMGNLRTAVGLAWKSGVAAEVIGMPAFSIGERIYLSKVYFDTAGIFAWTAVVVLLSRAFEWGVMALSERFFSMDIPCREPLPVKSAPRDIRIQGMNKSFGGKQVLHNFSMEIPAGSVKWISWPSGGGKTTLLRILMGLERADEDRRTVISGGDPSKECCVLFQEDRLCNDFSAVKNVELVTGDKQRAREVLLELLEEELLEKPCSELSGGERRRVALARALAARGSYLLLDEPFIGLDSEAADLARSVILRRKGSRTLLIASHSLPAPSKAPLRPSSVWTETHD